MTGFTNKDIEHLERVKAELEEQQRLEQERRNREQEVQQHLEQLRRTRETLILILETWEERTRIHDLWEQDIDGWETLANNAKSALAQEYYNKCAQKAIKLRDLELLQLLDPNVQIDYQNA